MPRNRGRLTLCVSAVLLAAACTESALTSPEREALLPSTTADLTYSGSEQILVGQSKQLYSKLAAAAKTAGVSLAWRSTNTAVATVSSLGVAKGIGIGRSIAISTLNGKSDTINVFVSASTTTTTSTAPVATVTVSVSTTSIATGQAIQATATTKDAGGQLLSGRVIGWSTSNAAIAKVSGTGLITGVAAGSATIIATSEGKNGSKSMSVTTTPTVPTTSTSTGPAAVAALPRVYVNTQWVQPTGKTIAVKAGGNLQAAIDAAVPGDVITLPPGAVFVGPFNLKPKSGSGWITIRTAALDASLPAPGQRMTPKYASQLPKLVSTGYNQSVINTTPNSRNYRIMGVEITTVGSFTYLNALVRLGDASANQGTSTPSNLILDRVYIHGNPWLNLTRCVLLNSATTAIIDSYLSKCHAAGFDSQAIVGWNGPGPYKIVNNFLEGAGETIMFGGATPATVGLIPSDIEIRRNHFYKPATWVGGAWAIKNLFELKFARRVLVEGNIFDGNWQQAQTGYAMVIKTSSSSSWAVTEDVTIRLNRIRNVGAGFALNGVEGGATLRASRITIVDNVIDNVNVSPYRGDGRLLTAMNGVKDVILEHNTMVSSGSLNGAMVFDQGPSITRFTARNNILDRGGYGVKGAGSAEGKGSLDSYSPGYLFSHNVILGNSATPYPTQTYF